MPGTLIKRQTKVNIETLGQMEDPGNTILIPADLCIPKLHSRRVGLPWGMPYGIGPPTKARDILEGGAIS